LLCGKTQELQARLHLETARQALREGRFPEAEAAARQAGTFLKSTKLHILLAGLRFSPHLLRSAYRVYERFLERRRSRRLARFRANWNGAPGPPKYNAMAGAVDK
jgi:hypothetical protein